MKEYGQFCPVAKATELLGERWTILVIRELLAGAAHFNELRHGLSLMSPSLLSTRLKTLERHALVVRSETSDGVCYHLTESGEALRPIIIQLGLWGLQWTPSRFEDSDLDPRLLMWDMRRHIDTGALDASRTVLRFEFRDQPGALRFWWLIIEPGDVDVCLKDPGHEIDLYLATDLATMARVWMGALDLRAAMRSGKIQVDGESRLRKTLPQWLGRNPFAHPERLKAMLTATKTQDAKYRVVSK